MQRAQCSTSESYPATPLAPPTSSFSQLCCSASLVTSPRYSSCRSPATVGTTPPVLTHACRREVLHSMLASIHRLSQRASVALCTCNGYRGSGGTVRWRGLRERPHLRWTLSWLCRAFPRTAPLDVTTPTPVSSQLLSIPRTVSGLSDDRLPRHSRRSLGLRRPGKKKVAERLHNVLISSDITCKSRDTACTHAQGNEQVNC